jgi:hypothetical protein
LFGVLQQLVADTFTVMAGMYRDIFGQQVVAHWNQLDKRSAEVDAALYSAKHAGRNCVKSG